MLLGIAGLSLAALASAPTPADLPLVNGRVYTLTSDDGGADLPRAFRVRDQGTGGPRDLQPEEVAVANDHLAGLERRDGAGAQFAICGEPGAFTDFAYGLAAHRVLAAIREFARTGRWIDRLRLPMGHDPQTLCDRLKIPEAKRPRSIEPAEGEFIARFLGGRPVHATLQTGCAFGCSAAYILSATRAPHIAIDPYKHKYNSLGKANSYRPIRSGGPRPSRTPRTASTC